MYLLIFIFQALGHIYEHKALELIFHYMNVKKSGNARLSFETMRFLGSLLFHKKFCIEFVNIGGIQKLLQVCLCNDYIFSIIQRSLYFNM